MSNESNVERNQQEDPPSTKSSGSSNGAEIGKPEHQKDQKDSRRTAGSRRSLNFQNTEKIIDSDETNNEDYGSLPKVHSEGSLAEHESYYIGEFLDESESQDQLIKEN